MSTAPIGMSEYDQAVHYVSRAFYLAYCDHQDKEPTPPPWVPGWSINYARTAITYLGYDDEALASLARDYR